MHVILLENSERDLIAGEDYITHFTETQSVIANLDKDLNKY